MTENIASPSEADKGAFAPAAPQIPWKWLHSLPHGANASVQTPPFDDTKAQRKRFGGIRADLPTAVYIVRFHIPPADLFSEENPWVFKLGITHDHAGFRILESWGVLKDPTLERSLWFPTGIIGRQIEKGLKVLIGQHRYEGPQLLMTGNTEVFTAAGYADAIACLDRVHTNVGMTS